jgi:putative transposase
MNLEKHHRRSIRLPGYDYAAAGGYFVTIVTSGRRCLFGEVNGEDVRLSPLGEVVKAYWQAIPDHYPNAALDEFVVMPNHIHGIIILHEPTGRGTIYRAPTTVERFQKPTVGSIPTIIRTFKAAVTRRAGVELNMTGIWQRNYFEHILRGQEDYEHIAGYIIDNPRNWGQDEENQN